MSEHKPLDVGQVWSFWFTTSAFDVDKRLRRLFRRLPRDPRCKFCNAPFRGIGGIIVRSLFGKQRSGLNPRICNICEEALRRFPGGAEVEMSMLFADVRGSTALSEKMSPFEFSRLINRFYTQSTKVITEEDGLVDISAIGDEVNTAARLASKAASGEIIVSEQALKDAGVDGSQLESRSLDLKGISLPVLVRVMHAS